MLIICGDSSCMPQIVRPRTIFTGYSGFHLHRLVSRGGEVVGAFLWGECVDGARDGTSPPSGLIAAQNGGNVTKSLFYVGNVG